VTATRCSSVGSCPIGGHVPMYRTSGPIGRNQ
jgi:hypothetical protein